MAEQKRDKALLTLGTLVEFMQDNVPQIAWLMEEQNGKVRLMLPSRRETSFSSSRLLPWSGPSYGNNKSKEEIIQLLNDHKEKRQSLLQSIDIIEIWEMTQGEVKEESPQFFAELMESEPTIDHIAAYAHALLAQKSHFKFQNPLFEVYPQELVEAKKEAEEVAKAKDVIAGIAANWFHYLWSLYGAGEVYQADGVDAPKEPEQSDRLKNMLMQHIIDPETQKDNDLWKQSIKQLPNADDAFLPLLLAIAWGIVPYHYNFWLARADYDKNPDYKELYKDLDEESLTPFAVANLASLETFINDLEKVNEVDKVESLRSYQFEIPVQNTEKEEKPVTSLNLSALNFSGLKIAQKQEKKKEEKPKQEEKTPVEENALKSDYSYKSSLPLQKENTYQEVNDFLKPYFDKPFISIDSATTKDIDDAFTLEKKADGYHITVALAAPATIWEFGSPFDNAIFHRSTSIYLPEATYHLMPEALSTDLFSLKEKCVRPALLVHCVIAEDGSIVETSFDFARVTVQNNLHYNACEQVLDTLLGQDTKELVPSLSEEDSEQEAFLSMMENLGDESDVKSPLPYHLTERDYPLSMEFEPPAEAVEASTKYGAMLCDAYAFAKARLAYRINQGAVIIEKDEMRIRLEEESGEEVNVDNLQRDTQVFMDYIPQNEKAMLIVSELMILANTAVALFADAQNIPLLFRTQDLALPKEFAGVWRKPEEIAKVSRGLGPAKVGTKARPHVGLGLKAYSPITSPLRRYADLINEAQLLHFLYHKKVLWNKEEMDALLLQFNIHNEAASQVQRMRPRYWRFVALAQEAKRHGEKCGFHAIISDENDVHVTITLSREQLLVRGKRALFGEKAIAGKEVLVRLGKINPLRGEVTILAVQDME